jgi:bifunctional DNA-binding transcriptional regulator/antitoxin component of YhaV-PrlF toxin-antitoxin module
MITSKITKRGQTTLPRQIRNALRVEAGQSLVYDIRAEGVILRAHPGSSASYGALKGKKTASVGYEEERRSAREDWVDQVAEEGKKE